MDPTLTFHGAAGTVTGSMHLLEAAGARVLVDCGLFQGRRSESEERNRRFPFDPASLDAVILTHAHIDHSGSLPTLVKAGFRGSIWCTPATRDLCSIMLRDSAHVQLKDAEYVNRKGKRRGLPPAEPLYSLQDALKALDQFVSVAYERPFAAANGVHALLRDAGHILGSAVVEVELGDGARRGRLGFTGDLGRTGAPILRDPVPMRDVELIVSESTYGGKTHPPYDRAEEDLAAVVRRTIERGGKILVPAFSVGRTQELVYYLHRLFDRGVLPAIPIYVDSPLSADVTQVFRLHPDCYDDNLREWLDRGEDPFGFRRLTYVSDVAESKALNGRHDPCVILSASGMCEAGRILHHLAHNIEDARNTVLIVGYMAEHTLGKKLVDRWPRVRIFGDEFEVRAEVAVMNAFSAHADQDGITEFLLATRPRPPSRVYLVHGDPERSDALAAHLRAKGFAHAETPVAGQTVAV